MNANKKLDVISESQIEHMTFYASDDDDVRPSSSAAKSCLFSDIFGDSYKKKIIFRLWRFVLRNVFQYHRC